MKRFHAAALAAVLVGSIPCWAQQPAKSDVITVTGADGKPHACKVLRTYKAPGGGIACDVRDQVSGEEMTVVENTNSDDVKAAAKTEPKTESEKPSDPILQPKDYSGPKVQDLYESAPAAPVAPATPATPATPKAVQNTKPPTAAPRRWFNWFRGEQPTPKPIAQQSMRVNPPATESVALYDSDPVIRLIGCMSDDLLPSMREISAETLARNAKERPETVTAMIRTVTTDPAPSVRVCCCRCLVEMKVRTPECMAALKSLEGDESQSVRTAAAAAMSVLAPQ